MRRSILLFFTLLFLSPALLAQGTLADYQRAQGLQAKARNLVVNTPGAITWIGDSDKFWYPRSVQGGTEFVLGDAHAGSKQLAFDHDKLAAAISRATEHTYKGLALPFAAAPGGRGNGAGRGAAAGSTAPLTFLDGEKSISFGTGGSLYKCTLTAYECTKQGPIPQAAGGRGGRGGAPEADQDAEPNPEGPGGDPVDGLEYQPPAPQDGNEGIFGRAQRSCAPRATADSQGRGGRGGRLGVGAQFPTPAPADVCASFDGKWEAFIQNFNVFVKTVGDHPAVPLSFDGSEGNYDPLRTVAWSPDSKKLAA